MRSSKDRYNVFANIALAMLKNRGLARRSSEGMLNSRGLLQSGAEVGKESVTTLSRHQRASCTMLRTASSAAWLVTADLARQREAEVGAPAAAQAATRRQVGRSSTRSRLDGVMTRREAADGSVDGDTAVLFKTGQPTAGSPWRVEHTCTYTYTYTFTYTYTYTYTGQPTAGSPWRVEHIDELSKYLPNFRPYADRQRFVHPFDLMCWGICSGECICSAYVVYT